MGGQRGSNPRTRRQPNRLFHNNGDGTFTDVTEKAGVGGSGFGVAAAAAVPVLFRDGDLVFVTPDAVLGIIEVKTRFRSPSEFRTAVEQLSTNARWAGRKSSADKFFGVFAYDAELDPRLALVALSEVAAGDPGVVVDLICLGERDFIRWAKADPHNLHSSCGMWRAYQRLDGKAVGYFLHNAIQFLAPKSVGQNIDVWFPTEGK